MTRQTSRAVVLALSLAIAACGKAPSESPPVAGKHGVLLFAIDGLEWSVLDPLLAEGELPAIASLIDRGTAGCMQSMTPTLSPVIWTSVATGKRPRKHGIRSFVYREPAAPSGERRYYTSGHRRTKAFWNILSDHGFVVHSIGWWMTYPAEPINGLMVSQTNTTKILEQPNEALWKGRLLRGIEGQVHPPERQNQVMQLLDESERNLEQLTLEIFGRPPHPPGEFEQQAWNRTLWAFRADATYLRVAQELLSNGEPFDVLAVYLGGADVAAHRFWRYLHPEEFEHPPEPEQIENYGRVLTSYYAYLDRAIGDLLQRLPSQASVLIVSDHGMHAVNRRTKFTASATPRRRTSGHHGDAPPGVIIAAGPAFRSQEAVWQSESPALGSVMDVTPTLLAVMGVPQARDMDGMPMWELLTEALRERAVSLEPVDTHDSEAWLATREGRIRDAVDQAERLEQLRSLGYIQ